MPKLFLPAACSHFPHHSFQTAFATRSGIFIFFSVLFRFVFCVELLISLICYYSSTTILYRHSYPSTIVTKPCSVKVLCEVLLYLFIVVFIYFILFLHMTLHLVYEQNLMFCYEYDDLPLTSTHKQEMIMFLI